MRTLTNFFLISLAFTTSLVANNCDNEVEALFDGNSQKIILNFDEALQRSFNNSPSISSAQLEVEVQEGEAWQASLLPNPEFSANFDRFGGSNNFNNFDEAEFTYAITQLVELGGKRSARMCLSDRLVESASWNQEIVAWNLRLEMTDAFIKVAAAQEMLHIALEKKKDDSEALQTVIQKVEAGKVADTQRHRAEINLARSTHALNHAYRQFVIAKNNLAILWGSCPDFDLVKFSFYEISIPPSFCDLETDLDENPDLYKWEMEILTAEEELNLQLSHRVPDVLISAGVVDLRGTNDTACMFEIDIPIPIFDRNQGQIAASQSRICLAQNKQREAHLRLLATLSREYQEWTNAYYEAISYRDTVLNMGQLSYEHISECYNLGKNELLDLIDARQALCRIQEEYIQALTEYHLQKAKIVRLLGKNL